jgi:hypothetical protein
MDAQMMVNVVVFAMLALLGIWITRRVPAPQNQLIKMFWLVLLVVAPAIGSSTRLIDIAYIVYFNVALQGIIFGLVAGWWANKSTQ